MLDEFLDPITLDLLEDPVLTPCCGNSISRLVLQQVLEYNPHCPLCKSYLDDLDCMILPKNRALSNMIEEYKKQNSNWSEQIIVKKIDKKNIETSINWQAKIIPLINNTPVYSTLIGQLHINSGNNNFKTLLIPVIDISGSMSGNPTIQAKFSLQQILDLSYNNSNIITNIVTYSNIANKINIDTKQPIHYYKNIIENIRACGGTSFNASFNKILEIINQYSNNIDISSIVVIFLTDGEDTNTRKNERNQLSNKLKDEIDKIWNKQWVIHTIGFGDSHDYEFLNNLRQIGKIEGAYRFADPNEDTDSLSSKISSLVNVIASSSFVPIKIISSDNSIPIISGENCKYWVNLTGLSLDNEYNYQISINNDSELTIPVEFVREVPGNINTIWSEWYSYLIDQIASELIKINSDTYSELEKELHSELLLARSRSIISKLESDTSNYTRLTQLISNINRLQKGEKINEQKLNDLKFEGKFATVKSSIPYSKSIPTQNIGYNISSQIYNKTNWIRIERNLMKRLDDTFIDDISSNYKTKLWIDKNISNLENRLDSNKSNILEVLSSIGRVELVKYISNKVSFDLTHTNKYGYNALDLALIYGYWKTATYLIEIGMKPNYDIVKILKSNLLYSHFNTAELIIKNNLITIDKSLIDESPNQIIASWLSEKSQLNIPVEIAISKCMYQLVKEKINQINGILSWKPYLELLSKPTDDSIKIIELLLEKNKLDPNEEIKITVVNTDNQQEEEIVFPMFIACEKGNYQLFKTISNYWNPIHINKQNLKGTTCLWIASCNKHIDIVYELLTMGADPNICNFKGDSPLIPCCQKGSLNIVEILLEAGADIDVYNKNRDNPILICCRTGQAKILEFLFNKSGEINTKRYLETWAEIDGFVPLLAATELDKTECIITCLRYGADIETRTLDDNKIIQGATALHLACFYGRLASVKILLENGADINSQTRVHGLTPLHIAIKQGHIDIVRLLLNYKNGKNSLEILDNEGRKPEYYANIMGNDKIKEEFFTNKLVSTFERILVANPDVQELCANIIKNYSSSIGCYELSDIMNITFDKGSCLLSEAFIHGNKYIVDTLLKMGCNIDKPDEYGITPAFWANYFGYDIDIKPETYIMIDRIKKLALKNFQNKLLLSPVRLNEIISIEYDNNISLINKMTYGYNQNIEQNTLTILNNSIGREYPLLGFLDKLKTNRIIPEGKNKAETIILDAKINLIKIMASNDTILQPVHALALYLYSSNYSIFENVNISLINWKETIWSPLIYTLYQAIYMLPGYVGEVYRAVNCDFNPNILSIGSILQWNNFSICSTEWKYASELINKKCGIIFIIKSKNGKHISKYSRYPVDNEVIFMPGTTFIVKNYFIASTICLGQENIRMSSFIAKEKDITKAINKECSICVEIEEIEKNLMIQ